MIVEMLFAERNHVCAVCVSNGHCELQNMAVKLEIDHVRFPYRFPRWRWIIPTTICVWIKTGAFYVCDACACAEKLKAAHTKDVKGRGVLAAIIHDLDQPWGESQTCTGCGKCVNVCPTGALTHRGTAVGEMTKKTDFLPYLTLMREAKS